MKKKKIQNAGLPSENSFEISPQDLNLIRSMESSRIRRKNIEWFSI